jgi:hypothetical protein
MPSWNGAGTLAGCWPQARLDRVSTASRKRTLGRNRVRSFAQLHGALARRWRNRVAAFVAPGCLRATRRLHRAVARVPCVCKRVHASSRLLCEARNISASPLPGLRSPGSVRSDSSQPRPGRRASTTAGNLARSSRPGRRGRRAESRAGSIARARRGTRPSSNSSRVRRLSARTSASFTARARLGTRASSSSTSSSKSSYSRVGRLSARTSPRRDSSRSSASTSSMR